jgi:hypothetical protein
LKKSREKIIFEEMPEGILDWSLEKNVCIFSERCLPVNGKN